jgi:predicted NBD/HSP70 family sugar kinase
MGASTKDVVAEILRRGPLARSELARRLGLSPASLTKLTRPLLDDGLLCEGEARQQVGTGRPSLPLNVVADRHEFIGIKLNRVELYAVRTDLHANVLDKVERSLTSNEVGEVVAAIEKAVDDLDPDHVVTDIGISLAGNIRSGEAIVRQSAYLDWSDVPLGVLVEMRTGRRTVLANDVRALTAAQHWFGEGRGSSCFAVLTVGKGVGCGMVVNDRVVSGYDGHAGLASHLLIKESGPLCRHGHRGCATAYLSSGAITRSLAVLDGGRERSYDELLEMARDGHAAARRVFTDACDALGVLMAHIGNLIGPDRIVLSGEGIGLYGVAPDVARESMDRHLHTDASPFEVVVAPFAFTEWARGAAVAVIQSLLMTT